MKRLGLICNSLPATLFLALAGHACAQEASAELLRALPPRPAAPPPVHATMPVATLTPADQKKSEPTPTPRASASQPSRARMLELFDKNKDGRLDDEERAAAKKYAQERGVRASPEARERMAKAAAASETMRAELRRRFDRNGNGKIDDDEMPALEQAVRTRVGSAAPLRQRYDQNRDGKLDEKEWSTARGQIQQWVNSASAR